MDAASHIEINPHVMMGKPVVKGTRITVELILESLFARESVDNLLISYPRLTKEAISVALAFAVEALKGEKTYYASFVVKPNPSMSSQNFGYDFRVTTGSSITTSARVARGANAIAMR